MTREEIKAKDSKYIVHTYNRFDLVIDHAKGSKIYDVNGKEYLDFCSGYATCSLGYGDEGWMAAVKGQLDKIQHTSNLYYHAPGADLAEKLVTRTGLSKVYFGNTGGEANEAAIKIARKFGNTISPVKRNTIITLEQSFHGRTMATVTATGLGEAQEAFAPLVPGFVHVPVNDCEALTEAVTKYDPIALMFEFVQGEGGVEPLTQEFVDTAVGLCVERDMLLIDDEVQAGIGRTGKLFAYENYGIKPDIVSFAKGIAGGLPIGGVICGEKTCDVLVPGDHGSTFGMNPVSSAAGCYVLDTMDEAFLADVCAKGAYLCEKLCAMSKVVSTTGMGLFIGINLEGITAGEAVAALLEEGVMSIPANGRLRFIPPLSITMEEIDEALDKIEKVLG